MRYSIDVDGLAVGFVHKRILGGIKGFIGGGPLGALSGFAEGGRRAPAPVVVRPPLTLPPQIPVRRTAPRTLTARAGPASAAEKELGKALKFAGEPMRGGRPMIGTGRELGGGAVGTCLVPGMRPHPVTGRCEFFFGDRPGRDTGPLEIGPGVPVGDAVMGRYGAAYVPGSRIVDRAICLPGDLVGDDGLCYPRASLRNNQRAWPAGRKPLLTGGEMRAITVAATAGRRLERASKRLQKIGLMKKPAPRARKITSGPTEHHHH